MTTEESQKEFEAWMQEHHGRLELYKYPHDGDGYWSGKYQLAAVQLAWEAWQKAREK